MKYYVTVQLRRYDDTIVGESSWTCERDISEQAILAAARVAGESLAREHLGVRCERGQTLCQGCGGLKHEGDCVRPWKENRTRRS